MSYLEEHHHGYIADTEPFKYDFDEPVDDSFGAVGGVDIPTGIILFILCTIHSFLRDQKPALMAQ